MTSFNWNNIFLNNYGTPAIELVEGEGVIVKDSQGNIYLDFLSGIAVNSLGHAHPVIINAVGDQIKKLSHTSNFYANEPAIKLAEKLIAITNFDAKVFFCNSGTEANEAAIKLSRRTGRKQLIAANNSFHGRTMGSLSITGQSAKQKPFEPLIGDVRFIDINTKSGVRKIKRKTAAVFLESIQGEGGVTPCDDEFLQAVRNKTSKSKTLLVMDEVQTGLGRTGKWFGYEESGIKPDVITLAKGLGGGLPMGAMLVTGEAKELFEPGQHGSTFGGNPIAAKVAIAALEAVKDEKLIQNARELGELFRLEMTRIIATSDLVLKVRGKGLLNALVINDTETGKTAWNLCLALKENGLLAKPTHGNIIRFAPPLIITKEQITECIEIIEKTINSFKK